MKYFMAVFLCALFTACDPAARVDLPQPKLGVDEVLDQWHQDAANADFEAYFSHFENEESIFMGTDETERWTIAEFRPWSKPYFDRGKAWSFEATDRWVYYNSDSTIAWFDEELATPNLGPSRGSGVLKLTPEGWKIAHYNLSIPIPNAIVGDVVRQIERANDSLSVE
ncbi:nuclear transport factor 2 family protein [Phaeocystidibacter luteus]|uniref:Nuclear transport factor 2 family protein n=1 Tax=Phaeocystidibacter luteus TaxID=911197 RepID=A0A6N6RJQ6_9FLAO|nr:nuclear transport factor 2 family protein [Phaeocystidibacter luteus]KAB2813967.1 nuclear transport factor 2 family protein [Phaeocystidibacter luteus]